MKGRLIMAYKVGFAGTDARTLISALVVSTAKSKSFQEEMQGVVIRGTPGMPKFTEIMEWPVDFIPTADNSVGAYAEAIIQTFRNKAVDCVIPMSEALLFDGLVDEITAVDSNMGDRVAGLSKAGVFIEADKIECKNFCRKNNIPVADRWMEVDAKDYKKVLEACLILLDCYGGAVLKYPYSAGGKGARIIRNTWEIREVYQTLMQDYKDNYQKIFGNKKIWPLLIESLMSGVEISFAILVDKNGHFQILPTAMDYPERFAGPASKDNPITGGMGSISPHPIETKQLIDAAAEQLVTPLVNGMKEIGILRPCVLYPGCFVSLDSRMNPTRIRVSEVNIRPGEPEFQPVVKRIRNFGALVKAMFEGNLHEVKPEVRNDQVSICLVLATGTGGPKGQKGYPWSCTKGEPMEIDFDYFRKKAIQIIPSAMDWYNEEQVFKSDGTRVAFLNANATFNDNPGKSRVEVARQLQNKLLKAFDNNKIRVIPRESEDGNRLDIRRDVGSHYTIAESSF